MTYQRPILRVPVIRAKSETGAAIVMGWLEDADIDASMSTKGSAFGGMFAPAEILVAQDDHERATELIIEHLTETDHVLPVALVPIDRGSGLVGWVIVIVVSGIALGGFVMFLLKL